MSEEVFQIEELDQSAVLCYVDGWAYFTTCPLDKQWGDDWNDAPYEHNAGRPYEWREGVDLAPYKVFRLGFYADYQTPGEIAYGNSRYSVEQINARHIPWLTPYYNDKAEPIFAGETMRQFVDKIQASGGTVYVPLAKAVLGPTT